MARNIDNVQTVQKAYILKILRKRDYKREIRIFVKLIEDFQKEYDRIQAQNFKASHILLGLDRNLAELFIVVWENSNNNSKNLDNKQVTKLGNNTLKKNKASKNKGLKSKNSKKKKCLYSRIHIIKDCYTINKNIKDRLNKQKLWNYIVDKINQQLKAKPKLKNKLKSFGWKYKELAKDNSNNLSNNNLSSKSK